MNTKTIVIIILLAIVIIGGIYLIKLKTTGQAIVAKYGYGCEDNDLIFRQSGGLVTTRFPCGNWSTGGCYNGQCMSEIDNYGCRVMWVCSGDFRGYQTVDCKFTTPQKCQYGCKDGNCIIPGCGDGKCAGGVITELRETETKSVALNNKVYQTKIGYIYSDNVQIYVDEQLSQRLKENESQTLKGVLTYIKDIKYSSKATANSSVVFILGENSESCSRDC